MSKDLLPESAATADPSVNTISTDVEYAHCMPFQNDLYGYFAAENFSPLTAFVEAHEQAATGKVHGIGCARDRAQGLYGAGQVRAAEALWPLDFSATDNYTMSENSLDLLERAYLDARRGVLPTQTMLDRISERVDGVTTDNNPRLYYAGHISAGWIAALRGNLSGSDPDRHVLSQLVFQEDLMATRIIPLVWRQRMLGLMLAETTGMGDMEMARQVAKITLRHPVERVRNAASKVVWLGRTSLVRGSGGTVNELHRIARELVGPVTIHSTADPEIEGRVIDTPGLPSPESS